MTATVSHPSRAFVEMDATRAADVLRTVCAVAPAATLAGSFAPMPLPIMQDHASGNASVLSGRLDRCNPRDATTDAR